MRQPKDPSSESWAVAASTPDSGGVGGGEDGNPAVQFLPTLPARLEDETRKREDAEHNLVLFRKVSPGPASTSVSSPLPRACVSRVASVGAGR